MSKFVIKILEAPNLPSFFKSKRPRQFNYRPWFYDPAKEEREKRNRLIRAGSDSPESDEGNEIRLRLHEKWRESNSGARQRSRSNIRLIIIAALLLLISYYLFN